MPDYSVHVPEATPQPQIDRATVQALGGGTAIAPGLTLPPFTAGRLALLALIDSPLLAGGERRAAMTMEDLWRAAYIWHDGPAAVVPVQRALRQQEALLRAEAMAKDNPDNFARWLAALACTADGWAELDSAALAFAEAHDLNDLPTLLRTLSRAIEDSYDGFGLLPASETAQKKTGQPHTTANGWRARAARWLRSCRQSLTTISCGACRWLSWAMRWRSTSRQKASP